MFVVLVVCVLRVDDGVVCIVVSGEGARVGVVVVVVAVVALRSRLLVVALLLLLYLDFVVVVIGGRRLLQARLLFNFRLVALVVVDCGCLL